MAYVRFGAGAGYMRAKTLYNVIHQQDKVKTLEGVVMKKVTQADVPCSEASGYPYWKRNFLFEYNFRCEVPCFTIDDTFATRK